MRVASSESFQPVYIRAQLSYYPATEDVAFVAEDTDDAEEVGFVTLDADDDELVPPRPPILIPSEDNAAPTLSSAWRVTDCSGTSK